MNQRERDSLDRYITGDYGERQFRSQIKKEKQPMPRTKPDDPFQDDDWGAPGGDTTGSDEVPESTVDPDRGDFLKPWHLDKREGTIELVSVSGATEFSDITLHLKLGRKSYRLGLRTFDPAFDQLRKKFGPKKSDWHGTLRFRIMPHKGKPDGFVAVRPMR